MESNVKTINNPLIYQNQKQRTLDEARVLFMKYLQEFAKSKNLSNDEVMLIKDYIEEVYLEKKASYVFEDKLRELNLYLNRAFFYALSGIYKKQSVTDNFTKVFYYRNKKGVLNYE